MQKFYMVFPYFIKWQLFSGIYNTALILCLIISKILNLILQSVVTTNIFMGVRRNTEKITDHVYDLGTANHTCLFIYKVG